MGEAGVAIHVLIGWWTRMQYSTVLIGWWWEVLHRVVVGTRQVAPSQAQGCVNRIGGRAGGQKSGRAGGQKGGRAGGQIGGRAGGRAGR